MFAENNLKWYLLRKAMIKDLDISEDLKKNLEIDIQKMTDVHISKIDELMAIKEKEIMTV